MEVVVAQRAELKQLCSLTTNVQQLNAVNLACCVKCGQHGCSAGYPAAAKVYYQLSIQYVQCTTGMHAVTLALQEGSMTGVMAVPN